MTCTRCKIRNAAAVAGLCTVCLAGLAVPGTPHHHPAPAPAVVTVAAAQPPGWPGHDDPPHPPEVEAVQPDGPDMEINFRRVLVVDDPRYGVLNGRNYIGYCDGCPAEQEGRICPAETCASRRAVS